MSEGRALTNCIGNGVATMVVGKWAGERDEERFRAVLADPSLADPELADVEDPQDAEPARPALDAPAPAPSRDPRVPEPVLS